MIQQYQAHLWILHIDYLSRYTSTWVSRNSSSGPLMTSPTWHPVSIWAKASMPLVWHVLVGGGGRRELMSVRLLALRLVRVVPAIVRSVATWFEVGDYICGRDMWTCKKSSMFSINTADRSCSMDSKFRAYSIMSVIGLASCDLLFPL